jgi:hypothetical protein
MVLSGHFRGPVVLLGISLTTEDEARFFRGVVRASQKVGSWPRPRSSGNQVWIVHAEKGDGGLADAGRATLEAAAKVTLVRISGSVFLLLDEAPHETAAAIADAVSRRSVARAMTPPGAREDCPGSGRVCECSTMLGGPKRLQ